MFDDLITEMKGFLMSPSETFKKTNGKSLGAAYQYYVALLADLHRPVWNCCSEYGPCRLYLHG